MSLKRKYKDKADSPEVESAAGGTNASAAPLAHPVETPAPAFSAPPVKPSVARKPNSKKVSPSGRGEQTIMPLRKPQWLYLQLAPINPSGSLAQPLDEPTLRMHLLAALIRYLGETGAAIPVDILRISQPATASTSDGSSVGHRADRSQRAIAYIRTPYADGALFAAAVASWGGPAGGGSEGRVSGYRMLAKSAWLACLDLHDEDDALFDFGAG